MPSKKPTIQFSGSPAFADFLKGIAKANPTDVEILSSREDKDSARLGLDFGLLWHVLVSVAETYSVTHMSVDIARYLLTSKNESVTAKTPVREITIKIPPNATKEEIERIVRVKLNELLEVDRT